MRGFPLTAMMSVLSFTSSLALCLATMFSPQIVFSLFSVPGGSVGHTAAWLSVLSALMYAIIILTFAGLAVGTAYVTAAKAPKWQWVLYAELVVLAVTLPVTFWFFIGD